MKVKSVEQDKINLDVYTVTLRPNWLEKLFGVKEVQRKYRDNKTEYLFGDGCVYTDQTGNYLGNHNYIGEAIDKWRRRW